MNVETLKRIRRLRARRYTAEQICQMMHITPEELKEAMWQKYFGNTEPTEETIIDDEPLRVRVERMKAEIKAMNIDKQVQIGCRNYHDRMPRHYCEVPAEIR